MNERYVQFVISLRTSGEMTFADTDADRCDTSLLTLSSRPRDSCDSVNSFSTSSPATMPPLTSLMDVADASSDPISSYSKRRRRGRRQHTPETPQPIRNGSFSFVFELSKNQQIKVSVSQMEGHGVRNKYDSVISMQGKHWSG